MRGRKPKPLRLHVLDGTYRRDRHGPAPVPDGQLALLPELEPKRPIAPEPPRSIKGTALRVWAETVEALEELGILDQADGGILALYCEARAELSWATYKVRREGRLVKRPSDGAMRPHPAIAIKNAAALRAGKFAAELGLSPTARARLRVGSRFGPDDPDPEESDLD